MPGIRLYEVTNPFPSSVVRAEAEAKLASTAMLDVTLHEIDSDIPRDHGDVTYEVRLIRQNEHGSVTTIDGELEDGATVHISLDEDDSRPAHASVVVD